MILGDGATAGCGRVPTMDELTGLRQFGGRLDLSERCGKNGAVAASRSARKALSRGVVVALVLLSLLLGHRVRQRRALATGGDGASANQ